MRNPKVTIVGAGPGGLASAMLLAEAGCEVTVLEREHHVGGRTSTLELEGGFRFDRGPTFFLYPEVLESIFRLCGRDLYREVELQRLDPNYRLVFEGDTEIDVSSNLAKLKSEIAKLNPADAAGVDRYLAANRTKLERFKPVLESPFNRHSDVLKLPLLELLPLLRPWASVDADLKRYFKDPRTRLAFSFQSKYLGMSPFKCPSLFTILAFLEYEFGVFHPRGGCGAVSAAMARVASEMGVEIKLGEPVRELGFAGKRVRRVVTDRGDYAADALVINADFAGAMRALVPDRLRNRWRDARIERSKMSCSTFMLYLGIEGELPELAHHTILLSQGYREHLDSIERSHVLPEAPALYVHNPSRIDPTLAPPGMSSLYVLVPVTHRSPHVDWDAAAAPFRELVLERLGAVGIPSLRGRIRAEQMFTPADWEGRMGLYKGATFSLAHSLDQMLSLRPHNRFEDLESVYLVGGGTHPGSGLPVIYQSAKISSRLLAEDFGLDAASAQLPRGRRAWGAMAPEAV
jgi:phytoene desaturase